MLLLVAVHALSHVGTAGSTTGTKQRQVLVSVANTSTVSDAGILLGLANRYVSPGASITRNPGTSRPCPHRFCRSELLMKTRTTIPHVSSACVVCVHCTVCGNRQCELGEACATQLSDSPGCCPADCPTVVYSCTVDAATGAVCSGHGSCLTGLGVCDCYKGYTGDGCNACDGGYLTRVDSTGHVTSCVFLPGAVSSCSNGVLDGAEAGVDCGGVCPPCSGGGNGTASGQSVVAGVTSFFSDDRTVVMRVAVVTAAVAGVATAVCVFAVVWKRRRMARLGPEGRRQTSSGGSTGGRTPPTRPPPSVSVYPATGREDFDSDRGDRVAGMQAGHSGASGSSRNQASASRGTASTGRSASGAESAVRGKVQAVCAQSGRPLASPASFSGGFGSVGASSPKAGTPISRHGSAGGGNERQGRHSKGADSMMEQQGGNSARVAPRGGCSTPVSAARMIRVLPANSASGDRSDSDSG